MTGKKLTKAQTRKGISLWKACDAAHTAVYQGFNNVPFNDAYRDAPAHLRNAYDDACRELREYERALVADGRGWFNAHGYFAEFGSATSPWI